MFYRKIETFRELPVEILRSIGVLLAYDDYEEIVLPMIHAYYAWATGNEIEYGYNSDTLYRAFSILGNLKNIENYNERLRELIS